MLIDVTRTLGLDSIDWPGDAQFRASEAMSLDAGDEANLTRIEMVNHAGTHLDAPLHFFAGAPALDDLPIDRFRLPALVIEAPADARAIDAGLLDGAPIEAGEAVLFKTANAALPRDRFHEDYVALTPLAARRLVELGVGLVGVDYLSVDPLGANGEPAHRALLGAGVLILEDLDLRAAAPGRYTLYCFPLKLHRSNGAPCRAVLETEPE